MSSVQHFERDGVPYFLAPGDQDFATVIVRSGTYDGNLATSGLSELTRRIVVASLDSEIRECLAECNSDGLFTRFIFSGPEEKIKEGVKALSVAFANPDVSKLEREKRLLLAGHQEGANWADVECLSARYGAQGPGLESFKKFAYWNASAEDIINWSRDRFSRSNSAAVTSLLDLHVDPIWQEGISCDPVFFDQSIAHCPALVPVKSSDMFGFQFVFPQGPTSEVLFRILLHMLHMRITEMEALSPSAEVLFGRIDSIMGRVSVQMPILEQSAKLVLRAVQETLEDVASGGVGEEILALRRAQSIEERLLIEDSPWPADQAARAHLLPGVIPFDIYTEALNSLTASDIANMAQSASSSLIYLGDESLIRDQPHLKIATPALVEKVKGKVIYKSGSLPFKVPFAKKRTYLTYAEDGITVVSPKVTSTVRYQDLSAIVKDGRSYIFVSNRGNEVRIDPRSWNQGNRVLRDVLAEVNLFPHKFPHKKNNHKKNNHKKNNHKKSNHKKSNNSQFRTGQIDQVNQIDQENQQKKSSNVFSKKIGKLFQEYSQNSEIDRPEKTICPVVYAWRSPAEITELELEHELTKSKITRLVIRVWILLAILVVLTNFYYFILIGIVLSFMSWRWIAQDKEFLNDAKQESLALSNSIMPNSHRSGSDLH